VLRAGERPRLLLDNKIAIVIGVGQGIGLTDHVADGVPKSIHDTPTRAMEVARAAQGIRVTAVGPGSIGTPILKKMVKDNAFRSKAIVRTPTGRFRQTSEIAAVVVWLAITEERYLTGTTVYADGVRLPLNSPVPVPDCGRLPGFVIAV
jgi:hypothetical protein